MLEENPAVVTSIKQSSLSTIRAAVSEAHELCAEDTAVNDDIELQKFIDDYNIIEPVNIIQDSDQIRAIGSEKVLERVQKNATTLGMKINQNKTQMLCVSKLNNKKTSYALFNGQRLESSETLKILGFHFTSTPDASEQVKHIVRSFYKKVWVIVNLKRAGWHSQMVCRVYKTAILPVIEYLSPIYHSLLTVAQQNTLEGLHKRALKMIFGWDLSYEQLLATAGLETLYDRRLQRTTRFALKCEANERFRIKWLKENCSERKTRHTNQYLEPKTKTVREDRNPVNYLTRLINKNKE
jgi:hypothetical protein